MVLERRVCLVCWCTFWLLWAYTEGQCSWEPSMAPFNCIRFKVYISTLLWC